MASKRKTYETMTEALRDSIAAADQSFKALERETGVSRQSLMKFSAGEQSLRLDAADKLAEFFGFVVGKGKRKTKRKINRNPVVVQSQLADSVKGTKPLEFYLNETRHRVDHAEWKYLLLQLCKIFYEEHGEDFVSAVTEFILPRDRYFLPSAKWKELSPTKKETRDYRHIGDSGIYVATRLKADNCKSLCDAIVELFGYEKELQIKYH